MNTKKGNLLNKKDPELATNLAKLLLEKEPKMAYQLALFSLENNSDMCKVLVDQGLSKALLKTDDQGADFMRMAGKIKPELFIVMLDEGWGDSIRRNSLDKNNSNELSKMPCKIFLTELIHLEDVEIAKRAVKRFFQGCDSQSVTHILLSQPSASLCPFAQWMISTNASGAVNKNNIKKGLIEASVELGVNLDATFPSACSFLREEGSWLNGQWQQGPAEDQTVLSYLVLMSQEYGGKVNREKTKIVEILMDAGKSFDKQTASNIVRMNGQIGKTWLDFFVDRGDVLPSQIVAMTSHMKIASNSNTKALLSSMVAKESIDSLLKECPSP